MKQYITILKKDKEIYTGRVSDIPIKESFIIQKSVELFDDDDPCIIHQSYVIKEYVDQLLAVFRYVGKNNIEVKNHLEELAFLDFRNPEELIINLKG